MNEHKDIIGRVKELQVGIDVIAMEEDEEKRIQFWNSWQARVGVEFPDIAAALLALDENLKSMEQMNTALVKKLEIAMQTLEEITEMNDGESNETVAKVNKSLSRIRSL